MNKKQTKPDSVFEKQSIKNFAEYKWEDERFGATLKIADGAVRDLYINSGVMSFVCAGGSELPGLVKILRRIVEVCDACDTLLPKG